MNVIAIYHSPQECGQPYVAFVSQDTGQIIDSVDIPNGYYDSGSERVTFLDKVYSFQEKVNMSPRPTPENVWIKARFLPNPHHYVFKVTKIDNIKEDKSVFPTWTADVSVDACRERTQWKYSSKSDHFRHRMEKSGFNMKGWCCYKRQKTEFKEFLKKVCSTYKDYNIINLIEIG